MKESNGICSPIRIELRLHTTGEARRIEDELIQMMAYEIKAFTAAATIIMTFFFFLIGKTFFFSSYHNGIALVQRTKQGFFPLQKSNHEYQERRKKKKEWHPMLSSFLSDLGCSLSFFFSSFPWPLANPHGLDCFIAGCITEKWNCTIQRGCF